MGAKAEILLKRGGPSALVVCAERERGGAKRRRGRSGRALSVEAKHHRLADPTFDAKAKQEPRIDREVNRGETGPPD
jgi:hypothetical protein